MILINLVSQKTSLELLGKQKRSLRKLISQNLNLKKQKTLLSLEKNNQLSRQLKILSTTLNFRRKRKMIHLLLKMRRNLQLQMMIHLHLRKNLKIYSRSLINLHLPRLTHLQIMLFQEHQQEEGIFKLPVLCLRLQSLRFRKRRSNNNLKTLHSRPRLRRQLNRKKLKRSLSKNLKLRIKSKNLQI